MTNVSNCLPSGLFTSVTVVCLCRSDFLSHCLCHLFVLGTGFPVAGLSLKYTPGTAYKYKYNTDTKLEDTSSSTRRRAVGIAFKSDVTISPVWHDDQGVLFKLTVCRYNI